MKNLKYVLIVAALISACNKGSDPATDYKDVKAVPMHGTGLSTNGFILSPFVIKMEGVTDQPTFNLVAGKTSQIRFRIYKVDRVQEYTVEAVSIPTGSSLSQGGNPNVCTVVNDICTLTWTPDPSLVIGNGGHAEVPVSLRAVVTKASEPRLVGKGADTAVPFTLMVNLNDSQPQILGISKLSDDENKITKLTAGSITDFEMTVIDPMSSTENHLELLQPPCKSESAETEQFDGRDFLSVQGFTNPSPGKFVYQLRLDLKNKNLMASKSLESVELCFKLGVMNPTTGRTSGVLTRAVRAMYTPQEPKFTLPDNEKPIDVRAGTTIPLSFSVDAGKEYGVLSDLISNKDSFPGILTLEPVELKPGQNPNRRKYEGSWQVPDDVSLMNNNYSLEVKATHTVKRNGEDVTTTGRGAIKFKVIKKEPVIDQIAAAKAKARAAPPKPVAKPEVKP